MHDKLSRKKKLQFMMFLVSVKNETKRKQARRTAMDRSNIGNL